MHVLVVFGNPWQRIVVYVLLHDYINVHMCNLKNPHRTGDIERTINSTLLIYNWCFCFFQIKFSFNFLAHKHRLVGEVYF